MIVSIRMTEEEKKLADAYSKLKGENLSESIKRAYFEKIEDEYDIAISKEILNNRNKEEKIYSLKEIKDLLNL